LIVKKEEKKKKEIMELWLTSTITGFSVREPVDVKDSEPGILTSEISFHGNAGPNESKKFIKNRFNGSIAIKIIRRNCGVNVVVASKV
jgi:hypothetical protein